MKHKTYIVHIWFLDADLQRSASFLTNKTLEKSIDGCIGALISTYFYFIGIRSKKFYNYYFSKENIDETMFKYFPNWPLRKKPSFSAYGRKESKWCKQCHENYDYLISYLSELLMEYTYRTGKSHVNNDILNWLSFDIPYFNFPYANINITLPWKSLDLKYRKSNVIDGYRLKFMSQFEDDDPFKAYNNVPRNIPDFVCNHYKLNLMLES